MVSADPKIDFAMSSSEIMFWKRALHKYVQLYTYTHIYTHIWKALFQNIINELGIGIANPFFAMALIAFSKRSSLCVPKVKDFRYIWIHTNTYTYVLTHIHTHSHTDIYTHIHTHIHTHMHTYTHIHIYLHTYIFTYTYAYICIYIYIHAYRHKYTSTHIDPKQEDASISLHILSSRHCLTGQSAKHTISLIQYSNRPSTAARRTMEQSRPTKQGGFIPIV